MIYKLGVPEDVEKIPDIPETVKEILLRQVEVLCLEYGKDRDVDNNDGGYVLYVPLGVAHEELQRTVRFSLNEPELIQCYPLKDRNICIALYLLNNEYSVALVRRPINKGEKL